LSATILNVDGQPGNRHLRTRVLTDAGFRVLEAASGGEALAVLRAERPVLVLVDPGCLDVPAAELCRQIKTDPAESDAGVLVISSSARNDDEAREEFGHSADGFVRSGVEPVALVHYVRAMLGRQQAEARTRASFEAAERELRASEQRWRSLFEHAPYGIFRVTAGGRIVLANQALAAMLRYDNVDELLSVSLDERSDSPLERWSQIRRSWAADTTRGRPVEATWTARDGQPTVLLLWGRPVDDDVDTFEVFAQDLTERRRLEEEFRQAQKMEAIGQLAGGIAHDFNNLLTAILGYSELAIEQMPADDAMAGDLREIRKAALRAAALTQQLLAFSRRQVLRLQPTDVNRVVEGMEQMLKRIIGEHISIELRLRSGLPLINADAAQLEQVMLNLAVNARDAMPDGGRLTMTTTVRRTDADGLGRSPAQAGDYVVLSLHDTGQGMDAETQNRIFEPFFTTKARGKGTGLGLSTVYGIVQQLAGVITVDSRLGEGTSFQLYFPALTGSARPAVRRESEVRTGRHGGRETIMLVEDEDVLRRLARAVLDRQGYRVIEANGPAEALTLSALQPDSVDLILADVLMPGMRGWEMVDRLKPQQPRARVLYMSGYVDELETARDRVRPLISKPFKPSELLAQIRRVLDDPAS
jgi:PAS domain S-box-containing protein